MRQLKRSITASTLVLIAGIGSLSASTAAGASLVPSRAVAENHAEEIVVIAQRSGVPVWRVAGPATVVVLVGSVGSVSPGTRWDPRALDAALAQADRVMFPGSMRVNVGVFSAIGAISKWRSQASLPAGTTLQGLMTPEQWSRLINLRSRGLLKPGFERTHPFHLAMSLIEKSPQDRRKFEPGAEMYVRRYLRKNKAKEVPVASGNLKNLTAEFFGSAPGGHVPCLIKAMEVAEAGDAGARARANARDRRSAAWAARDVPEALAARNDDWQRVCWPQGSRLETTRDARLRPTIRSLLAGSRPTLAVVSLDALAKPGGLLDDLVASGFDVRGPTWKR